MSKIFFKLPGLFEKPDLIQKVGPIEDYIEKEAKSHGLVILPENLINRFDIISKLSTETRSKLEVILLIVYSKNYL